MRSVKYIALAVAAALLVSILPIGASADPAAYDVWVNGVRLTEANAQTGVKCGMGTAVYSAEEATLTITDATMTKIHEEAFADSIQCASVFAAGDLTLAVYGENTVSAVFSMGHNVLNCGVYCDGKLTVAGNGTLTVTGGLSTFQTAGIYARQIEFGDSVTVNANGGRLTSSVATCGYGVYAAGDLTMAGNCRVNAVSYLAESDFLPAVSAAVYCGETMTVSGNASVSAIANRSEQEEGDALLLHGSLSVAGGELNAKAVGENGCGIRIASDRSAPLTIDAGFVSATGGRYAVLSAYGKFSVHPEYKITGSPQFSAAADDCAESTASKTEEGLVYTVKGTEESLPAKSVYFVRPIINYALWVGGTQVNNYNCKDILGDGKAAYDKENAALTLNGAHIDGGRHENAWLYAEEPLALILTDGSANTVGGAEEEKTETAYGIYAANGLTVSGGGSLTVSSGDAQKDAFGIYVRIGALSTAGVTLQAEAGSAADNSVGIYVAGTTSGSLTVSEMAAVSGTGGRAAATIGVSANGSLSVTGASSLSGAGGNNPSAAGSVSYGVRSGGAMDVDDSSAVKGAGGDCGKFSIGVYALSSQKGITVRGGKLEAFSGAGAEKCYGLYAKTTLTVSKGTITAVGGDASGLSGSMSYAVTARTVALTGGSLTAAAGKASASCGLYADAFTVAGAAKITVTSFNGANCHALRIAPQYTSYSPVVYAGKEEPGELILQPTEATYINNFYVRIERLFQSEKIWYALPIFDGAGKNAGHWIGFTSDNVTKVASIGAGVNGTGAAEYYNGYIYGVTTALPFRFWRAKMDGATIGAAETISDSVRFSFGDMSYDYVMDKMYGLGTYNMDRAIFSIDVRTGNSKWVASVSGTEAELLTMAFNRQGECYGVDLAGILYRISLEDGKAEKIGATGLIPNGAQSMTFDRGTNELFWAYFNGQTGKSGFYYLDLTTGKAVNAGKVGGTQMELAGLFTIPEAYDVWIGGTRVNEENAHDVFGNRLVSFDPEAKTLTFNGMKITTFAQSYKNYSFGILARDMDIEMIFNGENAIALENVYTDYSASICVVNGKAKIKGGKLTVLSTAAKRDNTILCPDGLTVEDCELMVYSNHNGVTVNSDGAVLSIRSSTVGIDAAHVGLASVNGNVTIEDSTVAINADKDPEVPSCAVAAKNDFSLTNSTFLAQAGTNACVIAAKTTVREGVLEASGAEQAFSGQPEFTHKNGTAVVVANGKSEESRSYWDHKTPLTNYNYVKIAECAHTYDSGSDTECNICGHIRFVTPDGETYVPGDVDLDGDITSADARLALRRSVSLENYAKTSVQYYACDADRDRQVSSADARLILRASVGLETL